MKIFDRNILLHESMPKIKVIKWSVEKKQM